MGLNPRVVTEGTAFTWDGAVQWLARGQVIDVPAGSALEAAIGLEHLAPLRAVTARPVPAAEEAPEAPEPAKQAAPPPAAKPRASAPQDSAEGKADSEPADAGGGDAM